MNYPVLGIFPSGQVLLADAKWIHINKLTNQQKIYGQIQFFKQNQFYQAEKLNVTDSYNNRRRNNWRSSLF